MTEFICTLKSLHDSVSFKAASPNPRDIENFISAFFSLFPGVDFATRKINSLHQNSRELKSAINVFVNTHKSKLPTLNAVAAFFNRLPEGDPFYFIPFQELTLEETIATKNYLISLKDPSKDFKVLQQQISELFNELLSEYTVSAFGAERKVIGERNKAKRVCRFCNNTRKNLSFDKTAHAISEALGNKIIILLEECDGCNEHFSKTIEPDLIEYLSLFRTMYGIKGKGGDKHFTGKNFSLTKTDKLILKFESDDERTGPSLPMTIPLHSHQSITLQNIYKTLTKYFLSVIPNEYLADFSKTVQWINGDIKIAQLPKIASLLSYDKLSVQPELITYLRKTANKDLPYAVGEFHFALYRYVFIVPGSNNDNLQFLTQNEYNTFWEKFRHYNKVSGWKFEDFSNNTKKPFSIRMNLDINKQQQEKNETDQKS